MAELVPQRPGPDDPGPGRRLGVDVGDARVGVSVSDPDALMAVPVETVRRSTGRRGPDGPDIDRIVEIAEEYDVVEVVVGLPLMLDGSVGTSSRKAADVAFRLTRRLGVPSRLCDERMTTVTATRQLRDAGVSSRDMRSRVDQAAAVAILQNWLDMRKRNVTET